MVGFHYVVEPPRVGSAAAFNESCAEGEPAFTSGLGLFEASRKNDVVAGLATDAPVHPVDRVLGHLGFVALPKYLISRSEPDTLRYDKIAFVPQHRYHAQQRALQSSMPKK